ncbi:hypothetical protein CANARDRAFT_24612 [[Candida] arabinofermentans NRRL YB-2248]|uniref:Uncharacterized protein n=1 Tax=[Candida] arabinofermentans NRRL YB-2248 TaxID=983967 RepID=A0A1E4SWN8_9ASCO|nr:hypothetical protein CANARDRAFT_24612 [[Candida] arabinofermentans NRRL YB-2248]
MGIDFVESSSKVDLFTTLLSSQEFSTSYVVDLLAVGSDSASKKYNIPTSLTIAQLKNLRNVKHVELGASLLNVVDSLFCYLSFLEASLLCNGSNKVVIVIVGLLEILSISYSKIISPESSDIEAVDVSYSKLSLLFHKLRNMNHQFDVQVRLMDDPEVIRVIDHVYFSVRDCSSDLLSFEEKYLSSLRSIIDGS